MGINKGGVIMKIVHIITEKEIEKTPQEIQKDMENPLSFSSRFKTIPLKKPIYIVEMSAKEIQVVSFYLELEKRKPILNLEIGDKQNEKED